jgi:hypothetical protein
MTKHWRNAKQNAKMAYYELTTTAGGIRKGIDSANIGHEPPRIGSK